MRALSKELRLRVFTLRVLLAIHTTKARHLLTTMSPTIRKVLRRFFVRFLRTLVEAARTSILFLRKVCLKYPRAFSGVALVSLSLLSLIFAEPRPQRAEKSADRTVLAQEPQLSLLLGEKQNFTLLPLPLRTEYRVLNHAVRSSLYETALEHDIALPLLRQFVDVMSYDVDFQRDIWAGATFRMLLSQQSRLAKGGAWQALGEPVLEVAELYTGRRKYRYHRSGWDDAFYDKDGKPAKRLLRRTPMSGLRLTSRFGMRRHPILGYTRMHRGVDFAAPHGTPVLAAGDGVVRKKTYEKGYGRYVLLRHSNRLSTLYAHMRGFARGLRKGARVKQGQVIGYVGSSGLSTGAHLHYEIHRNGRAMNPRRVTLPEPKPLEESKRDLFAEKRRGDEAWLARGGSFEETSALAALRALGCEVWSNLCDDERRAER